MPLRSISSWRDLRFSSGVSVLPDRTAVLREILLLLMLVSSGGSDRRCCVEAGRREEDWEGVGEWVGC